MKKILIITLSMLTVLACEKEQPTEPQQQEEEDCNDFCKCGEVVNVASNPDNNKMILFIDNNCTGNQYQLEQDWDNTATGDNKCLDDCW